MPTYEFRNKNTGEIHQKIMKIAEREIYLQDNPELESILTSCPSLGDAYRLGLKGTDDGFKEVLSKIVERTPGASALNSSLSRATKRSM